jgi:prepilin-type N-terminal cleavage/methylation domain-containing protein
MGYAMNRTAEKGFTLVEVLIASAIFLFVLTALYSTYVMLSQYVRDTSLQAVLQGRTRIAVEKMARDIRLASDVSCLPAGTNITLTFDPVKMGHTGSEWTSQYRLYAGQILFRPDVSLGKEIVVIGNVNLGAGDKLFQYDTGKKLVTIDLKIENTSLTTTQSARLTTIIRARNAY